jgi:hypothetical protein
LAAWASSIAHQRAQHLGLDCRVRQQPVDHRASNRRVTAVDRVADVGLVAPGLGQRSLSTAADGTASQVRRLAVLPAAVTVVARRDRGPHSEPRVTMRH